MKRFAAWMVLFGIFLAAPALAEPYVYSNEAALNSYFECEDFDAEIPAALLGVFDSRLTDGDEILCGSVRMMREHDRPGAVARMDALLSMRRGDKVLLLSAAWDDGGWHVAVETDSFFSSDQHFDITVLPQHGEEGQFTGASLALVCGDEAFRVAVKEDGSILLRQYAASWPDGSTLYILADAGKLSLERLKDGVVQETKSAVGLISARLCGWTYDAFPRNSEEVAAWGKAHPVELDEGEAFIYGVNLREQPTGQSRAMGEYTARVHVLGSQPGTKTPWYHVAVGETTGWVSGVYLLKAGGMLEDEIPAYASVCPRAARAKGEAVLYSEPDGETLRILSGDTVMQIIAQHNGWLHVIIPNKPDWAMDWDGTYGFVRLTDVTTGVSFADVSYP